MVIAYGLRWKIIEIKLVKLIHGAQIQMPIELRQLRQKLIYEDTAGFDSITTDLDDIAALSQLAEIKQKKFGNQAKYYFVCAAVLGLVTFSISSVTIASGFLNIAVFLLYVGLVSLIIAGIYALFRMFKFQRLNLINYRHNLIRQVMQMLGRDLEDTHSIYLKLSFQKGEKKEYKTNTLAHPYKSGWKIDIFENQWLNIKGRFLDKTRFVLTITELSKRQYGWKRSSSGKNKYKSKVKSGGLEVNLYLTYSQRRYGAVKLLQNDVRDAIKIPLFSKLRGLKVTDRNMNLTVRISPRVAQSQEEIYQTIVAMFLSLYQVLNLAKMLSKEIV
ncbi:hypothetical protein PN465_13940 [Nodularia spumigena CS-584]|uniref:Uncharacterized protein n=1 Tax=Nodularia spumigena UHCC 0060 TaxID=3110300 RepID=A0ABU5UNI6_NODSP|nr:hypothetical protein [Nodularia spumigena]EAW45535.1 hypothetical protein N9414_05469 [Nodularia spumigena CCY9414]MDB9383311.1 hypothetical protein [Nodularia spumigena CS-584]MEA5525071.1 hypothetical protein [Nodularia spumigena UHCC 0143]MEA5555137.1 hypothetical protein [Nodularia spumigena CH309]MEA5607832.1 hypothetical protein [Nodularia spumigena UHCC 0060]